MKKLVCAMSLTLAAALGAALLAPQPALATTGQTCICVTPKPGKTATGKKSNGRPSKITVRWGNPPYSGTMAMVSPTAGQTAAQIAQALANQLAAAGLPVCPVGVNPTTGRAVFCIKCRPPNVGGVGTTCNDTGMREVTWRTYLSSPSTNDPFLRGVAGVFSATSVAQGGNFTIEVITTDAAGNDLVVDATVATAAGDSGASVTAALAQALTDEGFPVTSGSFDFGDGAGNSPALFIDAGPYNRVEGVGMISDDEGLSDLRSAAQVRTTFALHNISADMNGDGVIDGADFARFLGMLSAQKPRADLNRDGHMDEEDVKMFLRESERAYRQPRSNK